MHTTYTALLHKTLGLSLVLTAWPWQIIEGSQWEGGQHVLNVSQIHCTHRKIEMQGHKCQFLCKVSDTFLFSPCLVFCTGKITAEFGRQSILLMSTADEVAYLPAGVGIIPVIGTL